LGADGGRRLGSTVRNYHCRGGWWWGLRKTPLLSARGSKGAHFWGYDGGGRTAASLAWSVVTPAAASVLRCVAWRAEGRDGERDEEVNSTFPSTGALVENKAARGGAHEAV
jgi:hypothetical protein